MNATTNPPARTILDLLGATLETARLSDAVLLVIDAQREYVDGTLPLAGIDEALAVGGELLQRARAAGTPIVHILHCGGSPLFDPQGSGFQPAAPLIPRAGESTIEKTLANAFAGTGLQDVLAATGRKNLIVIGFMTHNCVSSTVRAAREKGYTCTVVAPATATRDLPDGHGGAIPAATLQAACLAGLSDTMAKVVWNATDILN
ncbi:MAG: cysteine hydrolase family protein [Propionivibrio sp.]